jgi:hypothetical protein
MTQRSLRNYILMFSPALHQYSPQIVFGHPHSMPAGNFGSRSQLKELLQKLRFGVPQRTSCLDGPSSPNARRAARGKLGSRPRGRDTRFEFLGVLVEKRLEMRLLMDAIRQLVSFPRPGVVLVATDSNYLREVLRRMRGRRTCGRLAFVCHASKVSAVTIVATSARTFRPKARALAANRRRCPSFSRIRRPPSCSRSTRFSSRR